jgi:RNA polymerase sigma factor (sigma-70 family)
MSELAGTEKIRAELVGLIPALNAFARRFYRVQTDADDLVQETLLKALANLEKFEEGTKLKSWLFTIMRNSFNTRFAGAKREMPGLEDCVSDSRITPPSQEWSLLAQDVEQACNLMPEYYRVVLEAVAIKGMSYDHAAEDMGCAVGTVKSRLNRARHHLIAQFGTLDD